MMREGFCIKFNLESPEDRLKDMEDKGSVKNYDYTIGVVKHEKNDEVRTNMGE